MFRLWNSSLGIPCHIQYSTNYGYGGGQRQTLTSFYNKVNFFFAEVKMLFVVLTYLVFYEETE